jgi:hypothetical protein
MRTEARDAWRHRPFGCLELGRHAHHGEGTEMEMEVKAACIGDK